MVYRLLALLVCAYLAGNGITFPAQETASSDGRQTEEKAEGYVLLTLQSGSYWLPLPREGEMEIPVRQTRVDGKEAVNILVLTPQGVGMASSTCENQDCVEQGFVSLSNREDRPLGNMILCLPNSVSVELYTPYEVEQMYEQP